jgi:hypothetical protein
MPEFRAVLGHCSFAFDAKQAQRQGIKDKVKHMHTATLLGSEQGTVSAEIGDLQAPMKILVH